MKILIILFSACLVISGCASKPSSRDNLYWADAALIALDGVSTSRAIRSGKGREVGFPKYVIGEFPSDTEIAAFSIFSLGVLESSRYWNPTTRKTFQWGILITRPGIIYSNFQIAFD